MKIYQGNAMDETNKLLKIGVVTAQFNGEVTSKLERGALETLQKSGVRAENIVAVRVAGAFEIPLLAQTLILKHKVDGVVALGAVIRGETSHYDYVCSAVESGCSRVALETGKPVGFGVLTTDNEEQALDRAGGAHGNKGSESALVVLELCHVLKLLEDRSS
jgi:6,7-dimethyl-8-ribityllumazine synthase